MVETPAQALTRIRDRRAAVTEAARATSAEIRGAAEAQRVGPVDQGEVVRP